MIVADVRTDGQGKFTFTLLHEFVVRIQVSIAGYDRWIGGDSFEEAQEFDLRLGEEITDVRYVESGLLLERPAETLGVHDDLIVEVYDADTQRSIWPGGSSMGGSSHLHAIANLSPGNYWLHITPAGSLRCRWLAQWYDRADDSAGATVIRIQDEGETVPIGLNLIQGGSINGTVSWTWSEETAYTRVCLTTASSAEHLGRLTLGSFWQEMSEERYEMLGLPDGGYKIGAWICSDYPYNCEPINVSWYPGTADWESAEVVEIRDLGDIEGIDLELP
jgi:hypothetical protein